MNKQIIKKYTLFKIYEQRVNNTVNPQFEYGQIEGYYDSLSYPTTIFDTKREALEYIQKNNMWGNYVIMPVYSLEEVY